MSSSERKRKKTKKKPSFKQSPESTPNPSLPDDLVVSCLARVSRLHYPTLSLVSKSFRSLLSSPELYKTRSSLGRTESCLYVCLSFHPDRIPRWHTLCRKPVRTLTTNMQLKKKPCGYALAKLPTPSSRSAHWSGLVKVGSDLYNIVGPAKEPSSSLSVLDCRSNMWREGQSMLEKRNYPRATVMDGKIYVTGKSNSMEIFDPKIQSWELLSSPTADLPLQYNLVTTSAGIDGKLYIFGSSSGLAYCEVDYVFYVYYNEEFIWYDTKGRVWRVLKGLKGPLKFPLYTARLADYGGKMAVLWGRVVASTRYVDKTIWCTVIALERRSDKEIWGKVEWKEPVLKVPKSCRIEYALAATL